MSSLLTLLFVWLARAEEMEMVRVCKRLVNSIRHQHKARGLLPHKTIQLATQQLVVKVLLSRVELLPGSRQRKSKEIGK